MAKRIIPVLDVGISGTSGTSGTSGFGTGFIWRGLWLLDVDYNSYDVVEYVSQNKYICILDHTSSVDNEPEVGPEWEFYWDLFHGLFGEFLFN